MTLRPLLAAVLALFFASFAGSASAQTCPVATSLEIRVSGVHCQWPLTNGTWSPCGLNSPTTLTIYNHDTGQPYQLQSCETSVTWYYANEVSPNQYVTTTTPDQGTTFQVSSAAVGNSWVQARIFSGTTESPLPPNTYIPFANGVLTTSAPTTTVSEGATAYINVHTTYSPTSFRYTVTNNENAAGRFTPVLAPLVVSFASGEYDKTIAIPTIDDSTAQGTGSIAVQIGDNNYDNGVEMSPVGNAFGGLITITDNDDPNGSPVLHWAQNSYSFAENASSPAVSVTRSGNPANTSTVDYLIGPSINTPVATGTLTFNPGETSKSIPVPIVNDNSWSVDRHWIAELRNPSPYSYLGSSSSPVYSLDVPITIVEDDPPPTLSINDVSMNEGNTGHSDAALNIALSAPFPFPFNVAVAYGGTATPGTDYTAAVSSIHFDAGQTSAPLMISVNGDTLIERDETVTATLSHVTGSSVLPGIAKAMGTLTIVNDDYGMSDLKLAAGTTGHMTVYLGNATQAQGTITLSSSNPDAVQVPASFVGESGRSTLGFDVQALSPGESTITAKFPPSLGGMTLSAQVVVSAEEAPTNVVITGVGPSNGPAVGGTVVTMTGLNFTPSCSVTFGETPAAEVSFLSASALEVTTPAHAAGATDVTVTCDEDQFALTNGFAFFVPVTRTRSVRH